MAEVGAEECSRTEPTKRNKGAGTRSISFSNSKRKHNSLRRKYSEGKKKKSVKKSQLKSSPVGSNLVNITSCIICEKQMQIRSLKRHIEMIHKLPVSVNLYLSIYFLITKMINHYLIILYLILNSGLGFDFGREGC